jgi:hypothetical protein
VGERGKTNYLLATFSGREVELVKVSKSRLLEDFTPTEFPALNLVQKLLSISSRYPGIIVTVTARKYLLLAESQLKGGEMPVVTVSKSVAASAKELPFAPDKPKPSAAPKPEPKALKPVAPATKETKMAKAKAEEPATKGRKSPNQKIKLLVKENPKRSGTESYNRYELYKSCKDTDSFIAAGGTRGDITNDVAKGYIELL